jgi:hypothetical protein
MSKAISYNSKNNLLLEAITDVFDFNKQFKRFLYKKENHMKN